MHRTMYIALVAISISSCDGNTFTGGDTSISDSHDEGEDSANTDTDGGDDPAGDEELDSDDEPEIHTGPCESDAHCNDDNPCTEDLCEIDYGTCRHVTLDADGDGYHVTEVDGLLCGGNDCDDSLADVNPGAIDEGCDLVDNDCDGVVDVADDDSDGYVDTACGGDDCNDEDPFSYPGATEICDGVDDDCDGSWADGGADDDADDFLDAGCGGDDCDDTSAEIHPGAEETCLDGIDQDCDTLVDGPIPMQPDLRVTYAPGTSSSPSLSWTGSRYGVAYNDNRLGKIEIYFNSVTAGGGKDGGDVRITDATGSSHAPELTWTGSEFGMVWWDTRAARDDIFFTKLDPSGGRLVSDVRVSTEEGESWFPSVAWTGSQFGVGWYNDRAGNAEVFYAPLMDDGTRAGSDTRITSADYDSWYPTLSWTGSELVSAWQDHRDGNYEIYAARFSTDGVQVGSQIRISDNAGASQYPSTAWTGSELGVAWFDRTPGNDEIYFASMTGDGTAVTAPTRITSDAGLSQHPSLIWTGSEYALSWFDSRSGDLEIYLSLIEADGTVHTSDVRVTSIYGLSAFPSMQWSGSELGIAWVDERDLDTEIYFTRVGLCD